MKKVKRMPRVDELVQREIALYLEKVDFPLKKGLVTVSSVQTAPDLRTAKVFISTFNTSQKEKEKILSILEEERFDIQTVISKNIHLKYTPVLNFKLDDSFEKGDRVLSIIRELEEVQSKSKG
ncbi:MAG TPA: 30S ribosome-binding factor RbfA [Victivallales bacterium]|nr:30S ribosome-binding factor RbfA [Victivallales bacterium]HPO90389.1 30S ribosome-binding factor RbfA [Victivallales bacterium]HRR05680.1 30S ribosome-binding factor RbfA [Victivallales bacterium]HRR28835.1 30S ribosome-binding factor RbfA [Victivallales bacterium]HRU00521.1 30S ribosome-binding factor RbfA [Victivallales bacterium]